MGGNFRLDALQAAVLRAKLGHVEAWTARRQRNAARYERMLASERIVRPAVRAYNRMVYNQYVVRVPRRDEVRVELGRRGIGTAVYYPLALHLQPCFSDLGYHEGDLPVSEQATREVLALPIYPELTEEQQRYVAQTLVALTGEDVPAGAEQVGPIRRV